MPQYDDYSKPIKFNTDENDALFTSSLTANNDWFWALVDFYTQYFDTLDATQFSAKPQKFAFGGNLITDKLEGN